jgi:hypothetical protein
MQAFEYEHVRAKPTGRQNDAGRATKSRTWKETEEMT